MKKLLKNIGKLIMVEHDANKNVIVKGLEMDNLPILENAWLIIENDKIHSFGDNPDEIPQLEFDTIVDIDGKYILPTWVDSHTHLVFAATREEEFVDKIKGVSYAEIAAKGGGILNSARKLQQMSEDDLFELAKTRLNNIIQLGTGAVEIKSGYGLTAEAEIKMLRVIRRLKNLNIIPIKATFLGAHAYPEHYKENKSAYIDEIIDVMLPMIAEESLADYIDVFCETGFFSVEESDHILKAGAKYGLKAKIHANQLNNSGGIQVGVANHAISVDHLETMGDEEIKVLQSSHTIPTLLPGAAFFLRMNYPPARALINANLPVCVASDYNPGSCPSGNMNVMLSLACIQMKMTPAEAITAQTINGAAALEMSAKVGTIAPGKLANFIITKNIPSIEYLPYSYGEHNVEEVWISGKKYTGLF